MHHTFTCAICKQEKHHDSDLTTGYATFRDRPDEKVCYTCAGNLDRQDMVDTGRATLYLVQNGDKWAVTNWPDSLRFACETPQKSRHNMARYAYRVWFTGPDGFYWYGVQYGDNTQLCHCQRTRYRPITTNALLAWAGTWAITQDAPTTGYMIHRTTKEAFSWRKEGDTIIAPARIPAYVRKIAELNTR